MRTQLQFVPLPEQRALLEELQALSALSEGMVMRHVLNLCMPFMRAWRDFMRSQKPIQ